MTVNKYYVSITVSTRFKNIDVSSSRHYLAHQVTHTCGECFLGRYHEMLYDSSGNTSTIVDSTSAGERSLNNK